MRKIILFSLLLPLCLILAFWAMRRFYTGGLILPKQPFSYTQQELQIGAVDGAGIPASLLSVSAAVSTKEGKADRPIVILVSSLNRDRNWDGKGLSPSMGRRVAAFLAQNGFSSIRFDFRGTGKSKASRITQMDTRLHKKDLDSVASYLKGLGYTEKNFIYLALGEYGAHLALLHLQDKGIFRALVLLNAKVPQSYLEAWGEELFWRMEEQNVAPAILSQCKKEWDVFYKTKKILKNHKGDPPDLQAFRNTLAYLLRPENKTFYNFSRNFPQRKVLQKLQKQAVVYRWMGEFVDPLQASKSPRQVSKEARIFWKSKQAEKTLPPIRIMKKTDFLLREQKDNQKYVLALLFRELDPTIVLSHDFQRFFLASFARKDEL